MFAALAALLGISEAEVLADIGLVIGKAIAEVFHRRATDPAFLAKSDTVFAQWTSAQTEDDKNAAQLALRDLMSS